MRSSHRRRWEERATNSKWKFFPFNFVFAIYSGCCYCYSIMFCVIYTVSLAVISLYIHLYNIWRTKTKKYSERRVIVANGNRPLVMLLLVKIHSNRLHTRAPYPARYDTPTIVIMHYSRYNSPSLAVLSCCWNIINSPAIHRALSIQIICQTAPVALCSALGIDYIRSGYVMHVCECMRFDCRKRKSSSVEGYNKWNYRKRPIGWKKKQIHTH